MIKGFIKRHPIISVITGGAIVYTVGKYIGIYNAECYHVNELNKNGSTTIFDYNNGKNITTILKPVVEAAIEEVAE